MKIKNLYEANLETNELFLDRLRNELTQICLDNDITLGFKIEGRIKTLKSIEDKMQRNKLEDMSEVYDIIGL